MSNGNNNRRWGDIIYRTVLMAMVVAGGGAAWQNAIGMATIEAQMLGHLATHPDTGLTHRLNAMQGDHDELERRVRIMEIRLGAFDGEE